MAAALCVVTGVLAQDIAHRDYNTWENRAVPGGRTELVHLEPTLVGKTADTLVPVVSIGFVVCAVACVVLYGLHWPRTRRITDFTITLAGVSPEFVRA